MTKNNLTKATSPQRIRIHREGKKHTLVWDILGVTQTAVVSKKVADTLISHGFPVEG